jgi:hypothetical protein
MLVQAPKVSNSPLNLSKSRQPRQSWRIVWLDAEAIAYGESEARRVWRAIRDCEASGEWPDYAGDSLSLPRWAKPEASRAWPGFFASRRKPLKTKCAAIGRWLLTCVMSSAR